MNDFSALLLAKWHLPLMFERLRKKWKVNVLQLILILCTFAIGGSLTGYVSRKLMNLFQIEQGWLWVLIFILVLTLIWPLAVILVSVPMGQFPFFINYLRKMGRRIGLVRRSRNGTGVHIAIFASGAGSNAQKIIDRFRNHSSIRISLIVSNNPRAGVLSIAEKEHIPCLIIQRDRFFNSDGYLDELREKKIEWIVLAGFLWKLPSVLISRFPGKIINIHPALLPRYGGAGMYGRYVHEAVIANKDNESGISIHYVDELYDHGPIIFQAKCEVLPADNPDSLAAKIHVLEHRHYAEVIEKLINEKLSDKMMKT